ncbi:kinase-like protein [Basidiobolus meristosporus CBS 931.73]|uniref:non-specific serine/threonine protein kinase n=1 Tax=Basidiobolus meristosporus CBS 931.73 TaxID=1314790 RepID=A0A1Y1XSV0_9FUNG|nr:kinase-like protein [Basidiobolus meristosporus CBS 931.73]|eukprot:ORX88765.1 kinase-like protein [Basidiobolus meristosporus CBS 931.73]
MDAYIHDPLDDDDDSPKVVDRDPTGRFERYEEALGIGGYKEVYKGFDQEEGVEVAWNQLRIDHLGKKESQKIVLEVEILKTLRHENIINLFHTWTAKGRDGRNRVYFITEMMTSGTLKQYIRRTKCQLKPRVLKSWCRQILRGLNYLHTKDPPIVHRDLKCDNIFINGNNGQAKIGDLGLATFMHKQHVSSVLGTPEFMAPELYDEHYDEKVDIYSFGMCVLEMLTYEYPYSECQNPAQIYRKVTRGIGPASLQRITDPDILQFIQLCIQHDPSRRPSAAHLLNHPFLMLDSGSNIESTALPSSGSAAPLPPVSYTPLMSESTGGWNANTDPALYSPVNQPRPAEGSAYSGVATGPHYPTDELPPVSRSDRPSYSYELPLRANTDGYQVSETSMRLSSANHCDVEIVQDNGNGELILRMTRVTPGSAPQTVKFPLNLKEDTPESVVIEMIKEELLSEEYKILAEKNITKAIQATVKEHLAIGLPEKPTASQPSATQHSSTQYYVPILQESSASGSVSSFTSSEVSHSDHDPDMSSKVDPGKDAASSVSDLPKLDQLFAPVEPTTPVANCEPPKRVKASRSCSVSNESPNKIPASIFELFDPVEARPWIHRKSINHQFGSIESTLLPQATLK